MATANEIISTALRLLQVKEANEAPTAAEGADGLVALNDLIDSWTTQDLMQLSRVQVSLSFTQNQGTYTIGAGGDINVTRPVSIENAFTRDAGNSDWEIKEINNDQYQRIIQKGVKSSYPEFFFYRPSYPLGEIEFWPLPGANMTLFMNVRANLNQYTDINQDIDWAPGYVRALKYALALEIAPEYRSDVPPLVYEHAQTAIERIKDTNNKNIPELVSDLVYYDAYNYNRFGYGGCSGGGGDPITSYTESGNNADTVTESGNNLDTITEDP